MLTKTQQENEQLKRENEELKACLSELFSNAQEVTNFHNPTDIEALKKAKKALELIYKKHTDLSNHNKYPPTYRECEDAIAEINKVLGSEGSE